MYVAPGATTAFALSTPLRDFWLSKGGPSGALGYPTSNAAPNPSVAGGWSAAFQHGQAWFDPTAGGGNQCIGTQCLVIKLPSFPIFVINP
jgi:hypothetical protein